MEKEETNKEPKICTMRGRSDDGGQTFSQRLECTDNGLSGTLTTFAKDNLVIEPKDVIGNIVDPKRGQKEMGVLETSQNLPFRVRSLTERELFRLMDMDDEDIDKIQAAGISKTQQAKMAGNSIVCACMYHIFRKLFIDTNEENEQLSLF